MTTKTELPTASSPTKVEPAAYNELVAAARLRDIRLTRSEFGLEAEAVKFQADWKLKHGCDVQDVHFAADKDLLLIWVLADAVCKSGNRRILWSKCKYLVAYDIHGSPSEEALHIFAKRVARFAAYPYFRAHFAELASQGGLHVPPLPIIRETKIVPPVTQSRAAIESNK